MKNKEKILHLAAKEFSKKGFEAASLEEIAKKVGITKAAIYYHFKNKSDLFEKVLKNKLSALVKKIENVLDTATNPEEKLKLYILTFGEFLQKNECLSAILAHEFSDNGKNLSNTSLKELSKTLNILTAILNEGIEKGIFEMENPMVVQLMIVSTLIMHQSTFEVRKRVTSFVKKHKILPEPTIKDLSLILSRKILKTIKKESR
jgi:AcrR family transcriptional regulator